MEQKESRQIFWFYK